MATTYTSTITTPAVTTTGTLQRTVADKFRELWPSAAPMLRMVSGGAFNPATGMAKQDGMLAKKITKTMKYEWYTFTPIAVSYTVASGSNLSPVLSSATGLTKTMTLINASTREVAVIDAISTNTLTLVAVGGSFTCVAGDKLLAMAPAYQEGSADPYMVAKDEDNVYNYVQNFRFPVKIARTAKGNPHYGGDYFERLKKRTGTQGMRLIENTMLFGERATSETTSTSNVGSVYTTRGAVKFSANTYDAGGSMTPEKFRKDMILNLGNTYDSDKELVMFCGRHVYADAIEWYADKFTLQTPGKYDALGIESQKIITAGGTVNLIRHNAFDQVGLQNTAFMFQPDDFCLFVKEGCDLQPANNIQDNDEHAIEDELWGTMGFADLSGGVNSQLITNWGASGAV